MFLSFQYLFFYFSLFLFFNITLLFSSGGWSFSVAGAVEGAYFIFSGQNTTTSLSSQQLISCDTSNTGCSGGLVIFILLLIY